MLKLLHGVVTADQSQKAFELYRSHGILEIQTNKPTNQYTEARSVTQRLKRTNWRDKNPSNLPSFASVFVHCRQRCEIARHHPCMQTLHNSVIYVHIWYSRTIFQLLLLLQQFFRYEKWRFDWNEYDWCMNGNTDGSGWSSWLAFI